VRRPCSLVRRAWSVCRIAVSVVVVAQWSASAHARTLPYPGVVSPSPCRSAQLSGFVTLGAATQTLEGPVLLRNRSRRSCTLHGYPSVTLLDAAGRAVPVHVVRSAWSPLATRQPLPAKEIRLGLLRRDRRAYFFFSWTNWCGEFPAFRHPLSVRVGLPHGGGSFRAPEHGAFAREGEYPVPSCQVPGHPSEIGISPFYLLAPGHRP
jgi:hypothetical protein